MLGNSTIELHPSPFQSSTGGYLVFPAPFVEKAVFSPMNV
jgi:hypothetical protein